jgi:hypothetical protein
MSRDKTTLRVKVAFINSLINIFQEDMGIAVQTNPFL